MGWDTYYYFARIVHRSILCYVVITYLIFQAGYTLFGLWISWWPMEQFPRKYRTNWFGA